MTEKKDTTHVLVPHVLVVFQRPRSSVWQCRYQVDGKWQRESTKQSCSGRKFIANQFNSWTCGAQDSSHNHF